MWLLWSRRFFRHQYRPYWITSYFNVICVIHHKMTFYVIWRIWHQNMTCLPPSKLLNCKFFLPDRLLAWNTLPDFPSFATYLWIKPLHFHSQDQLALEILANIGYFVLGPDYTRGPNQSWGWRIAFQHVWWTSSGVLFGRRRREQRQRWNRRPILKGSIYVMINGFIHGCNLH